MTVPTLATQVDGQAAVSADNFNTFVQGCTSLAQLRGFAGAQPYMQVIVSGFMVPGDGGAGLFYWNPSSTAVDDNQTVVVPTGVSPGAWLRLGYLASTPQ